MEKNTRPVRDTDTCKLDAFSLLFFFLSFFLSFFSFFFLEMLNLQNVSRVCVCVFVCVCVCVCDELMLKLLFHFKKNSFVQKFKSIFVREFHIERTQH